MDSYSEIIIEESSKSGHFTDFTDIACKGYNTLCKAKRYGKWWMLKGLKTEYRQDETYKNLLQKEFDILVSLQHPYIASAYSIEDIPQRGTCIVMEWIDGITLKEWNGGKDDGKAIFLQLLDAVRYIHAKQIVHRDLKPSNIMITHNGNHVKLIDFGLADADSYAILKQPAGTLGYISPEQATSRQADIRNDIYSLGCILETMQLDNEYSPIVKRCKSSIDKRYANVDELKADFIARKDGSYRNVKQYTVVALVCAIILGTLSYTLLYNKEEKTAVTPVYVHEQKDTTAKQKVVIPNQQKAVIPNEQKAVIPNQQKSSSLSQTDEIMSKGKKAIDKMWLESGIDTISSIIAKSEAFYLFVEKSNDFITSKYTQDLKIGDEHKTRIISELSNYTTEKYVKPTLAKFQSAE